MNKLILTLIIFQIYSCAYSQKTQIDQTKIEEDLNQILTDISNNYAYLEEKNINYNCIREHYKRQIHEIKSQEEIVIFFEFMLNEFYDSHIHLNTSYKSSYRLYSPIYATIKNEKAIISNVWQNQIKNINEELIGAELIKINGTDVNKAIEQFPTHCNDKNSLEVKEWIVNKLLAGRYNESRILTLKLGNNLITEFDLDKIDIIKNSSLLTSKTENQIGIIRINNSLGDNNLVNEFDKALDSLMNTKGLIIDLRNTVDGGNSYVARGIMSRFINESKPYQRHLTTEQYDGNPKIERNWVEYVSPRDKHYNKPVVILVGRWTGSMGEGLAIGFEGMKRAEIVGSEMERLAGEINSFSFKHQNFGYSLSIAKLYHINGTPREKYVPTKFVKQSTIYKDEFLEKGIELINKMGNKSSKE